MRFYNLDGTYHDHPHDTEFGWFFEDIAIDEAAPNFQQENENIKKTVGCLSGKCSENCDIGKNRNSDELKSEYGESTSGSDVDESFDVLENLEYLESASYVGTTTEESIDALQFKPKPILIHKIEPNVKEETPTNSIICEHSVEGFIENPESNFFKQIKSSKIPNKDDMIALISPVNPESKALLGVVSYAKYRGLNDKETNEEVLKSINFKTTNSKHLISEKTSPFKNKSVEFLLNRNKFADINFLLNDNEIDIDKQLVSEIRNYHATKEDNMLSLMMELIITDMDSNVDDMSELNHSINEFNSVVAVETSDLGNSIHSSILSKEGNGSKEKGVKRNYLEMPNRSDVLNSIGLSDDIDRSIECFVNEKTVMHEQLVDIKKSFENFDKQIDTLMDQASALQNDLRETTYLDNLIHLLKGNPDKVKNKKLPFRIFHRSIEGEEANPNLIL